MSQPARILLVTPEPVTIDPPTERLKVSVCQPSDWSDVYEQLPLYTHVAVGPVAGSVDSKVLLETAEALGRETATIFVLPGYEWIETIVDEPLLISTLQLALDGTLVVAPVSLIGNMPPPQWLADMGYRRASPLLGAVPHHAHRHLMQTDHPVAKPLNPFRLPSLAPVTPDRFAGDSDSAKAAIEAYAQLSPDTTRLMAGWFQINDDLDASHTLAQSIEGHPDGDYWHAIMHRREPDYGNSKYWFRHVGRHPVFAELAPRAAEILNEAPSEIGREWSGRLKVDAGWDPFAFVDMCQQAASDEDSDLGLTARRIQWIEMLLLLKHCARAP